MQPNPTDSEHSTHEAPRGEPGVTFTDVRDGVGRAPPAPWRRLRDVERTDPAQARAQLEALLVEQHGSIAAVAEALGVTGTSVYSLVNRHGLLGVARQLRAHARPVAPRPAPSSGSPEWRRLRAASQADPEGARTELRALIERHHGSGVAIGREIGVAGTSILRLLAGLGLHGEALRTLTGYRAAHPPTPRGFREAPEFDRLRELARVDEDAAREELRTMLLEHDGRTKSAASSLGTGWRRFDGLLERLGLREEAARIYQSRHGAGFPNPPWVRNDIPWAPIRDLARTDAHKASEALRAQLTLHAGSTSAVGAALGVCSSSVCHLIARLGLKDEARKLRKEGQALRRAARPRLPPGPRPARVVAPTRWGRIIEVSQADPDKAREEIRALLTAHHGRTVAAAAHFGVARESMRLLIRRLGLTEEAARLRDGALLVVRRSQAATQPPLPVNPANPTSAGSVKPSAANGNATALSQARERKTLLAALTHCDGSLEDTAHILGVSEYRLRARMVVLGLLRPTPRPPAQPSTFIRLRPINKR